MEALLGCLTAKHQNVRGAAVGRCSEPPLFAQMPSNPRRRHFPKGFGELASACLLVRRTRAGRCLADPVKIHRTPDRFAVSRSRWRRR